MERALQIAFEVGFESALQNVFKIAFESVMQEGHFFLMRICPYAACEGKKVTHQLFLGPM